MHKFLININDCFDKEQYGMFFYPFLPKGIEDEDTVCFLDVPSIDKISEALKHIQSYLSIHSLTDKIQILYCAKLLKERGENTSLYFDLLNVYFSDRIKSVFPEISIKFYTFIIGTEECDDIIKLQPEPEPGWREGFPKLYPDLTPYVDLDSESSVIDACNELKNGLSDQVSQYFYNLIFEKMIEDNESLLEGKNNPDKESGYFRPMDSFASEETDVSSAKKAESPSETINFHEKFKNQFDRMLSEKKVEHTKISFYRTGRDDTRHLLQIALFATQFANDIFSDALDDEKKKQIIDALKKHYVKLNAAKNSLNNISYYDPDKTYTIHYAGTVSDTSGIEPEKNLNISFSVLEEFIDEKSKKKFVSADAWHNENEKIRKKIENADKILRDQASDLVKKFNKERTFNAASASFRSLFPDGSDIEIEREALIKKKKDLEFQLNNIEEDNLALERKLCMLNIQSETDRIITFLIRVRHVSTIGLFILSLILGWGMVAVPYSLLQSYLLTTYSDSLMFGIYVIAVLVLFIPSYFIVRKQLSKAMKKQYDFFVKEYRKFINNYEKSISDFNKKINILMQLRAVFDKLAVIDDYNIQFNSNSILHDWHVKKNEQIIEKMNLFLGFVGSFDEDVKGANREAIIDIHKDISQNEAYWIDELKEEQA